MARISLAMAVLVVLTVGGVAMADPIGIYDIQHSTSDGDASIYDGQTVSVLGGVVTHIWEGFGSGRVYIQDPAHPTWGAIAVKDTTASRDLIGAVTLGDWVSFESIFVEESRGTTFLQFNQDDSPEVAFTIESSGHAVPAPMVISAADVAAPVDHAASEPYESMAVTLLDVVVGVMDLGKAEDNYELLQGTDIAWAADYMNVDAGGPYDPRVHTGAAFDSVTGIVEQYTKLSSGWDYYQVLTRSAGDIVPEPTTACLLLAGLGLLARRRR